MKVEWSEKAPTEPGKYWFWGVPEYGTMGQHYYDDYVPKMEMHLMDVHKISNGLLGSCEGQIVSLQRFNKEKKCAGYLGKFAKAILPDPPE